MFITIPHNHARHCVSKELFHGNIESAQEKPERIDVIHHALVQAYAEEIHTSSEFSLIDDAIITAVHDPRYISYLQSLEHILQPQEERFLNDRNYMEDGKEPAAQNAKTWFFCSDTYTAFTQNIRHVAKESYAAVHAAAMHVVQTWRMAYALTRPPGHHAMRGCASGYCYLANASICARFLQQQWYNVGILDIDFHHGNGAQTLFYDDPTVVTISIHADPNRKFPYFSGHANEIGKGEAEGTNYNIPLEAGVCDDVYLQHLHTALQFIQKKNITFLILSVGFDTYEKDPICDFNITYDWFRRIGEVLQSIQIPTLCVQEWWYNLDAIGQCAVSFFSARMK